MKTVYLVTGAAGHLGSTLTRMLCAKGEEVRALVLPGDKAAQLLPAEAKQYSGDVTDKASLEPAFGTGPDEELVVIHSAGIVSITSRPDEMVYKVNVGGTKNVVDLCCEHHVRRLIHVSSVHAIPEAPKGEIIREVQAFSPDWVFGTYAKTKAEATQYVLDAVRERGLNACVVHPSGISGPGDPGRGHLTQLVIDYCNGSLTAGVEGGYDFVDVRDVAAGILSCCEKGQTGACYILSNHYFTVAQVLELFHKVTGLRRVRTILPMWFAKSTAGVAEFYYRLRREPPMYTPYSMYTLSSNALFSHERAERDLGYTTRSFETTVRDTVDWLTAQGRIKPRKDRRLRKKVTA